MIELEREYLDIKRMVDSSSSDDMKVIKPRLQKKSLIDLLNKDVRGKKNTIVSTTRDLFKILEKEVLEMYERRETDQSVNFGLQNSFNKL